MNIDLKLNWQIEKEGEHAIDPLVFSLLTLIKQYGSLKRATTELGVSYRFAWGLLIKWRSILGHPLVILERGRGAYLSPIGDKLLQANTQLLARFITDLNNFTTHFKREFEALLDEPSLAALNIFASHGLAVGALRDLINQSGNIKLDLHFHGSLKSLASMNQGECHIAGFHIPIGSVAKDLRHQYLTFLDPKKYKIIYLVRRNQGLMFQQDNPKKIESLHCLSRPNINFINRQTDSGTRLLFDQLLRAEHLTANDINGYQHEEFTHMAVAAMIASGIADVGFGIAPMADKFNLSFIPLIWEHYCLAFPLTLEHDPRIESIISLLQSEEFKQHLTPYSGYDLSHSGEMRSFEQLFAPVPD